MKRLMSWALVVRIVGGVMMSMNMFSYRTVKERIIVLYPGTHAGFVRVEHRCRFVDRKCLLANVFRCIMENMPPPLSSAALNNKMTNISKRWKYENPNVWRDVEGE